MAYNSFAHGRSGWDACPNADSWKKCCAFAGAGCGFTRQLFCPCCPGGQRGEYDEMHQTLATGGQTSGGATGQTGQAGPTSA